MMYIDIQYNNLSYTLIYYNFTTHFQNLSPFPTTSSPRRPMWWVCPWWNWGFGTPRVAIPEACTMVDMPFCFFGHQTWVFNQWYIANSEMITFGKTKTNVWIIWDHIGILDQLGIRHKNSRDMWFFRHMTSTLCGMCRKRGKSQIAISTVRTTSENVREYDWFDIIIIIIIDKAVVLG